MKRIDEIEILRAIAISMVLLAHSTMLTGWPWKVLSLGTGVDLFLAISGFVITKSLVGSSAIPFWIRRAYRILPAAWLWLAVGLLATAYFNSFGSFGSLTDNVNDAIASLLQIQNVHYGRCIEATGRTCANGGVPFGIYWSLSLEEQFYLVLPFLFMLPRRLMCGGMLIAIALQLFTVRSAMAAQLRTDALLLGVLMGLWSLHPSYERFRPTFLRHPLIATAAVGSLIAALCLASKISSIPVGMAALISAALVFIASYGAGYIPAPVKPVLLWIGSRSYSLYLCHFIAFGVAREIYLSTKERLGEIHHTGPLLILLALLLLFAFAELTHRLVERPLQSKGRSVASRFEHSSVAKPAPQA